MAHETAPRIYVACLASYNDGVLYGRWIESGQTADAIRQEIDDMLSGSPEANAEEWAIHDYEGFGTLKLDETEDIEKIAELAELIEKYRGLVTHVISHFGGLDYLDDAKRVMEEDYCGEWNSLATWAEDLLDSTGQIAEVPEGLRNYIDFEKYAQDLELSGDVFTIEADGMIHVFWNR
jgi:antirestriction protein